MPHAGIVCRAAIILAIAFGLPTSAADAQSPTGDIRGVVVDSDGAPLAGATVAITNTATAATRDVATDGEGLFAAPLLPPGPYEVQASQRGFAPRRQPDVRLEVGKTISLRLELRVAPAAETITIGETLSILEPARSQASSLVDRHAFEHLPLRDGRFMDLTPLVPGVARGAAGEIVVAGQPASLNRITVDGGEAASADAFSQSAVQEFQIGTNAYPAEHGHAGAAVVNVITRSGANDFAGSIFALRGDDALNANTFINERRLGRPKPPYGYNRFGGFAGAPIVADRHFVFADYEGQRETDTNVVFLNLPPDTPSSGATQSGIARLTALSGSWQPTRDRDVWLVKTNHQLSDGARITLRYNHQNFAGRGFGNTGPQQSFDTTGITQIGTRSFVAGFDSVLSGSLLNEARVQYANDRNTSHATSATPGAEVHEGGSLVLAIGRGVFSERSFRLKRIQLADTLSWARGRHVVKGGTDIVLDDVVSVVPAHVSGTYVFNTIAAFSRGVPNGPGDTYTQAFEGAGTSGATARPEIGEYGFFAQDEWRVNPTLTVNAGIRYDVERVAGPMAFGTDTNNFGPRLGIAWAPAETHYVVRGGWGVTYARTPPGTIATVLANDGINLTTITFRGASGEPVRTYPNRFTAPAPPPGSLPTISTFDPDYQNARMQHASAGFEWEWMPNTSVAVTYLFMKGDHLLRATDTNIGAAVPATLALADADGNPTGTIAHYRFARGPFTNLARAIAFQSTAESRYHGLTAELNRRFTQGILYRLAYTLGKVEDTGPDDTALVPESTDDRKFVSNPADFDADRAPGNNDQRHRFAASVIYSTNALAERFEGRVRTLVRDWRLSAIYSAQTGLPFSAYASTDINGDNNRFNDLAPGTTRNQFRLPGLVSLDSRIARDIDIGRRARVTIIWQAFNLLNRANYKSVNDTMYVVMGTQLRLNPLFGQTLDTANPRMMQLGAKVAF